MSSTSATAPQVNNNYRWFQLIIGIIGMVAIANLQYGWALFTQPLLKHLFPAATDPDAIRAGNAAIAVSFSFFILAETWLVPFEGYLVDRFGPRIIVFIGGILVALAWIINSMANDLTALYAGGIIAGIGGGIVYGTASGNALKWFPDKRGLAAGLTAAGYGAGAALTVIPIANQIAASGYQSAFFTWGIIQGAVILVCALILRPPQPSEVPVGKAKVQQSIRDFSWLEMLKSPAFWLLYVMFTLIATGGLMATGLRGNMAADYKVGTVPVSMLWITLPALTFALSLDNIMNGITRPLFGYISDRVGRENVMFTIFIIEGFFIIGLVLLAANPLWFVLMSGLAFFAWGEIYSLFPATCGDLFGRKYATVNYGLLYTAKGTASLLVPLASLFSGSGNWLPVFVVAAVMAWISGCLALFVLKPYRTKWLASQNAAVAAKSAVAPASE